MILLLDVGYDEKNNQARAAGGLFHTWSDGTFAHTQTVTINGIAPYEPGSFWKRELPPLLSLISSINHGVDLIVIDGYVQLGNHPGMGARLSKALDGVVPVVGIAKTRFAGANGTEVLRGQSTKPLIVTSIGIDELLVANEIRLMHGPFRIPTLLKTVDHLSRQVA